MKSLITAEEYLKHCYKIPKNFPKLPLPDEKFVQNWHEISGVDAMIFLSDLFDLDFSFDWKNLNDIKISFIQTLAGKLPVIDTTDHDDFEALSTFVSNKTEIRKLPMTVNAFTISTEIHGEKHRIIILNRAPYSNISSDRLKLNPNDWLEKSHQLRLRHESAHYETLRLFGSMKNHALDEILADALGQISAFGNFSASRQRIFFGLHGDNSCDGRLNFYCKKVDENGHPKIFKMVNQILDEIESEIKNRSDIEILCRIAGKSLSDRLQNDGDVI